MNKITWKKTFSIFFVAIFSITAFSVLIFWSLSSKEEIIFHFGNNETINLNKDEINNLEEYAISQSSSDFNNNSIINDFSLYSNLNIYGDESDDGSDDDGGDDTSTPEIVFGSQTVNEMTADWMITGFMNYALDGDPHYPDNSAFNPDDYPDYESTILNPGEESSWITPHLFDENNTITALTFDDFYKYASYVKLFTETIGENAKEDYLPLYLNAFATKYDEISDQIVSERFDEPYEISVWTNYLYPDLGVPIFTSETMNLISSTIEYKKDIANFMYIYSYLWQESSSYSYDYILTSIMNQNRFTYYWTLPVNDKDSFNKTSDFDPSDGVTQEEWNQTALDISNGQIQINPTWRISPNGYMGFSGLSSKNDSSISLMIESVDYSEDFWNYANIWSISENENDGIDDFNTSYITSYNQDNFVENGIFEENNNYIFTSTTSSDPDNPDDTSTESYNIYMKYLLYPFAFTNDLTSDGQATRWVYRLDAYIDENGNIYPEETAPDGSTRINYFDYVDQEISPLFDNYNYGLFEILTIYQILNYTTENLTKWENKSYNYWNSKGFYIELHGQAKDDYGSLIPDGLQRD